MSDMATSVEIADSSISDGTSPRSPNPAGSGSIPPPLPATLTSPSRPPLGPRRTQSITQTILEANPPPGVWAAAGEAIARSPGIAELRRNSSSASGRGIMRRLSSTSRGNSNGTRKRGESCSNRGAECPGSGTTEEDTGVKDEGSSGPSCPGIHTREKSTSPMKGRLNSIFFEELDENQTAEKRASRMSLRSSLSGSGLEPRDSLRPSSRIRDNILTFPEVEEQLRKEEGPVSPLSQHSQAIGIGRSSTVETEMTGAAEVGGTSPEENPGWVAVTVQGLKAFWKWFMTPLGFFLTVYALNIVAWGAMLFLLLVNAVPGMCHPPDDSGNDKDCNDINSPRRKWIEWDSQILNALFCVTGFGLIPWRFRDLWYLMKWRTKGDEKALVKLRKIHANWWRPDGLPPLPPEEALPNTTAVAPVGATDISTARGVSSTIEKSTEDPRRVSSSNTNPTILPNAGTAPWKLDLVIHLYVFNTYFQICLSGFMWGMDRYTRPPWVTGLFVVLACGVAMVGGGMVWWEGRKLKKAEWRIIRREDEERYGGPPPA